MSPEHRELKKHADKELAVLERIKNNQWHMNAIIADVIALRNKQFSFYNKLQFSDSTERNPMMNGLETDKFEEDNITKLTEEVNDLKKKISDDIEDLI